MISNCRLCQGTEFEEILDLGHLCLTGIFPKTESEEVPRYPLRLVRCLEPSCELLQLADNQPLELMYGDSYGYRSGLNASMARHLEYIADKAANLYDAPSGKLVLDIGSSDATLLRSFQTKGLRGIGIDPSAKKFAAYYAGIDLIHEFFSRQLDPGSVDLVTSIAMFYDLEDPIQFARNVNRVLKPGGHWILEVAYAPKIIENLMYDSICHEHLEYYGLKQLRRILCAAGFFIKEVEFNETNGGSILVVAQAGFGRDPEVVEELIRKESSVILSDFSERVSRHRDQIRRFFADNSDKKIFGLGASTKGNVLLQYCGITSKEMPYISDVNEEKFGRYTPGTKIPIISEASAKMLAPEISFVNIWQFRDSLESRHSRICGENGGRLFFPLPHPELI